MTRHSLISLPLGLLGEKVSILTIPHCMMVSLSAESVISMSDPNSITGLPPLLPYLCSDNRPILFPTHDPISWSELHLHLCIYNCSPFNYFTQAFFLVPYTFLMHRILSYHCSSILFLVSLSTSQLSHQTYLSCVPIIPHPFSPRVQTITTLTALLNQPTFL